MLSEIRHNEIKSILEKEKSIEISSLCERLKVSRATIHRDLEHLSNLGMIKRTRGGAIFLSKDESITNIGEEPDEFFKERDKIAKIAANLVQNKETVILGSGRTTLRTAHYLKDRTLQVVTDSLAIANLLRNSFCEVTLIGGSLIQGKEGILVGNFALEAIRKISAQKVILGAGGLNENGISNNHFLVVEVEREFIKCGSEVIIVADHSKFGQKALTKLTDYNAVDRIVTSRKMPDRYLELFHKLGVEIIFVD